MRRAKLHTAKRTAAIAGALAILWAATAQAADIREAAAWPPGVPGGAVHERVAPAEPPLVDYLREDNRAHGLRDVPRTAVAHPELASDIREAVATMPPAVHALVRDKLIGLYTVRGLGSTAWAEHIKGADGGWRRGIVVLDIDAIDKRGNTWLSWRESTPFRPEPGFAVRARIAEAGADGRVSAIRYILLHEFAHVASIGEDYLPDWGGDGDAAPGDGCRHAFVCLSWEGRDGKTISRFDGGFDARARIAYYQAADKRLEASLAVPLYRWLATTDFVSAYAATSPHEDFAEGFANFVHVRLMGLPYRVEILRDGTTAAAAEPCWGEARCAAKARFLGGLLGGGG